MPFSSRQFALIVRSSIAIFYINLQSFVKEVLYCQLIRKYAKKQSPTYRGETSNTAPQSICTCGGRCIIILVVKKAATDLCK